MAALPRLRLVAVRESAVGRTALPVPRPIGSAGTTRREDIQVLRGLAVAAVLFFHAGLLPAGYLGVDLFFALSGYLMTALLLKAVEGGTLSLGGFYLRRAARLLPAALTTLAATTALAPFLLTPTDYGAFKAALLGALTASANIVLWLQTDYFAAAAETRPLLHMWSLSLEEQFYFVWPLALMLTPRRLWGGLIVLGIALSAGLVLVLLTGAIDLGVSHKRIATGVFYLLPTRAFELLIGAAAALVVRRRGPLALPAALRHLCLAAILVLFAVPLGPFHPGPAALVVAVSTALLCADTGRAGPARGGAFASAIAAATARLGDWSYSIYLVHWPLLAYANSVYLGQAPVWLRLFLVACAVPLGACQYLLVEQTFRHRFRANPKMCAFGLAAAATGCGLFGVAVIGPLESGFPQRASPNTGLAAVCDQRGTTVVDHDACRTRRTPRVALFGDSYAMQWASALAAEEDRFGGLRQITRSGCDPATFTDRALASAATHAPAERQCAAFMTDAAGKIAASPDIAVVVVSSSWSQILDVARHEREAAGPLGTAIAAMVRRFRKAGKEVLLLAPAPSSGRDLATCNSRREAGVPLVGGEGCTISRADDTSRHGSLYRTLLELSQRMGIAVVWPASSLCAEGLCRTRLGESVLYADRSHLTVAGAAHVARSLRLADILASAQRAGAPSPLVP